MARCARLSSSDVIIGLAASTALELTVAMTILGDHLWCPHYVQPVTNAALPPLCPFMLILEVLIYLPGPVEPFVTHMAMIPESPNRTHRTHRCW